MSSTAFQPYGLIKSPIEEALYHRAHIANVYTGIADPKESETSALMEVILYNNIFTVRDHFIVNSQQPPTTKSDKKCDIVVRYLENGTQKIRVLCFAECKRTRTSQPFSLKALERQAKDYAEIYLKHEDDIPFVYVATMAGAHIRLWTYRRDRAELVPFWGANVPGEWDQYKDVGGEEAGREIEYSFGQMKSFPPTPHAGQSSHTYGTSTDKPSYPASGSGSGSGSTSIPVEADQPRICDWSEWSWSQEYNCEARYRENSTVPGGWDYEYGTTQATAAPATTSLPVETGQQRISDWSEWSWSQEYNCEARYRENSTVPGGWDYEYRSVEPAAPRSKSSKGDSKPGKGKGKGY